MKKLNGSFVTVGCIILAGLIISQNPPAFAGWTGIIDGAGRGWASVNVRSSTSNTKTLTTVNNLLYPSAAMTTTTGYKTTGPLPSGAAATTFSRLRGFSGGFWQGSTSGTNSGDGTDNLELQNRVTITPSDCASLSFDSIINQSQAEFNANGNSGSITVNAKATAGTALWLRGFEYTGSMANVPTDDPATVENEGIEYLKINGVVRFETLVLGPFEFGGLNNCPLIVPFSLTSSNLEHLVFATDAAALSLPLVVICPPSISVNCDEPFSYPPVQYAGCGNITISYSPAVPAGGSFAAGAFPVGVNTVTATATDSVGNSTNCTFTVTVKDTIAPVPDVATLPVVNGTCSTPAFVTAPTATDNCAGKVTATTTTVFPITALGTTAVTWTFSDGNGNKSTQTQTVNLTGLNFQGFYSPVGTVNNSVSTPVTRNAGASFPLKWDMLCGTTPINGGTPPTVDIQKVSPQVGLVTTLNAEYQNDWHINWPTPSATKNDIYKATVNLPDGSKAVLFVKFK